MKLFVQIFIISMLIHAACAIHCYVCTPNTQSGESWDKCMGKDKLEDAVKSGKADSKDCSSQGVCCYCEMALPAGLPQSKTSVTYCGIQGQAQCSHGNPWNCSTCTSGDNCNYQLTGSQQGAAAGSDSSAMTTPSANAGMPSTSVGMPSASAGMPSTAMPNNNFNNNNNSTNGVAGGSRAVSAKSKAATKAIFEMPILIAVVLFAMIGR